jgi:hypothetical protein
MPAPDEPVTQVKDKLNTAKMRMLITANKTESCNFLLMRTAA